MDNQSLKPPPRALKFHYGWLIVGTGTLCLFACLGLGRFALGMLLPSMSSSLGLSYAQMGLISTANFLGYLVAVLAGGFAVRRFSSRWLIFSALVLVALSMALIGLAASFATVLVLFVLTGIGSGAANVPMMGLVTSWFDRKRRGRAAGFIVSGSGFAILLSGWMIPVVNEARGAEGWRFSWLLLSLIVAAVAVLCLLVLRDSPQEMGLQPVGDGSDAPPSPLPGGDNPPGIRRATMLHLGGTYFLFGFTYAIYVTFIVTFLVREHGYSESVAGSFWSVIGLLSLLSGPVFGTLSDRWGRKRGLMVVFAIQGVAYLLAASGRPGLFLAVSVGLFGFVAWSIPSIMAALVGDHVGPAKAAEAFGIVTFIFSFGQMAGPAAAGFIAELTGSFRPSFALAAAMAFLAVLFTARLQGSRG